MARRPKKRPSAEPSAIEQHPELATLLCAAWATKPPGSRRNYIRGLFLMNSPTDPQDMVDEARFLYDLCLHL